MFTCFPDVLTFAIFSLKENTQKKGKDPIDRFPFENKYNLFCIIALKISPWYSDNFQAPNQMNYF